MNHNEQLLAYVRESLAQGRSQASLANDLTAAGWPAEELSAVFETLAPSKPVMPLPPMPQPVSPEPQAFQAPTEIENHPEPIEPPVAEVHHSEVVSAPTPAPDEGDQHKKIVRVIVTTGAILLGVGVYYYLAIHWQDLPEALRIAIILLSMLAAYGSGWFLREKAGLPKIGTALILLGTVMYGAGIFLVGRMYNITGHFADGWALWSLGSLIMGGATGLYQLTYLGILLTLIAGSLYLEALSRHTTDDPARLVAAVLVIALTIVTAFLTVRLRRQLPATENNTL